MIEVTPTDLASEADASAFVALVDAYARDPMGGSAPLPGAVRERLVPDLRARIASGSALVLIARRAGDGKRRPGARREPQASGVERLPSQAVMPSALQAGAGEPLGVAVCFIGYSTFAARPLLNLHDLAVVPNARGAGVGRALLAAVEAQARARGCVKLTLEVREDNARARRLYQHVGFADYAGGAVPTRTLFLERKL